MLQRPYVRFEVRTALELGKKILLIHEDDPRHGKFDFAKERAEAPVDLQKILDNHESLPFRRRGYERTAMLDEIVTRAGYEVKHSLQDSATFPPEVPTLPTSYVGREAFVTLKALLVDTESSSAPVLKALGMGGTM